MSRIFIFLFLFPSVAFGAFTEFYCQSGGNNLNAGSTTGNSAVYTSNAGNWTNSTRVFTVTDGTNPSSSVSVGDFGSVYVTSGATVATFVGRVSTVQNATNGTVTFASTFAGTNPSNGTGTMTLKTGGAWKGPNAATAFPLSLTSPNNLTNASGDQVRINLKNDANYSLTSNVAWTSAPFITVQGYSSTVADGGKAVLTSSSTTSPQFSDSSSQGSTWIDLIWDSTGASGTAGLLQTAVAGGLYVRNVFRNSRNWGTNITGGNQVYYECEWYNNNVGNVASSANCYINASVTTFTLFINSYSHDASHGDGYFVNVGGAAFINSIADSNPGNGVQCVSTTTGGHVVSYNSDLYNNTGDGYKNAQSAGSLVPSLIVNSNFIKNGGKGINITVTGQGGIVYNNGYGAGTQANGSSDTLQSIIDTGTSVTYASGVAPWTAPSTGNFSINLPAAEGVGRGHFEENDGTNTGTVGYPDIGAAQAQIGVAFPTPSPTATATATPTSTPIPTSEGVAY